MFRIAPAPSRWSASWGTCFFSCLPHQEGDPLLLVAVASVHAHASRSPSPRRSEQSRGSNRTGRLRPAQSSEARRRWRRKPSPDAAMCGHSAGSHRPHHHNQAHAAPSNIRVRVNRSSARFAHSPSEAAPAHPASHPACDRAGSSPAHTELTRTSTDDLAHRVPRNMRIAGQRHMTPAPI